MYSKAAMWSRIGRSLGLYGPAALETEPIVSIENAGITSPPPEARHPVKIEPGLNDFAYPQELLDADIPDCSQRAKDIVDDLQNYHQLLSQRVSARLTLAISTRRRSSKISMRRTCGNFS